MRYICEWNAFFAVWYVGGQFWLRSNGEFWGILKWVEMTRWQVAQLSELVPWAFWA